jgi:hypothetical protein
MLIVWICYLQSALTLGSDLQSAEWLKWNLQPAYWWDLLQSLLSVHWLCLWLKTFWLVEYEELTACSFVTLTHILLTVWICYLLYSLFIVHGLGLWLTACWLVEIKLTACLLVEMNLTACSLVGSVTACWLVEMKLTACWLVKMKLTALLIGWNETYSLLIGWICHSHVQDVHEEGAKRAGRLISPLW